MPLALALRASGTGWAVCHVLPRELAVAVARLTQHHRIHASLTRWHLLFLLGARVTTRATPLALTTNMKSPEVRPAPKPRPIGSFPFLLLCTTATACLLFVIWRRSETLRTVVAHQCVQCGPVLYFSYAASHDFQTENVDTPRRRRPPLRR